MQTQQAEGSTAALPQILAAPPPPVKCLRAVAVENGGGVPGKKVVIEVGSKLTLARMHDAKTVCRLTGSPQMSKPQIFTLELKNQETGSPVH